MDCTALRLAGLPRGGRLPGDHDGDKMEDPQCLAGRAVQLAVGGVLDLEDGAVGADPRPAGPDSTDVYGVGAFLLAGSEMLRLYGN